MFRQISLLWFPNKFTHNLISYFQLIKIVLWTFPWTDCNVLFPSTKKRGKNSCTSICCRGNCRKPAILTCQCKKLQFYPITILLLLETLSVEPLWNIFAANDCKGGLFNKTWSTCYAIWECWYAVTAGGRAGPEQFLGFPRWVCGSGQRAVGVRGRKSHSKPGFSSFQLILSQLFTSEAISV